MCDALHYLLDNIFIRFGSKLYRQIVGMPLGTKCGLWTYELQELTTYRLNDSVKIFPTWLRFSYESKICQFVEIRGLCGNRVIRYNEDQKKSCDNVLNSF